MATVHTIQNGLPSPLTGNNVSREQPQSIENSKEFNQTTTDAIHEPSTFSDRVNFSFLDFSDPINTPFREPYTFSDPIVITSSDPSAFSYPTHTTFLESLANSSSSVLHSWFFLYSRKNRKSNPGKRTIPSVTYVDSPTFRRRPETVGLPLSGKYKPGPFYCRMMKTQGLVSVWRNECYVFEY